MQADSPVSKKMTPPPHTHTHTPKIETYTQIIKIEKWFIFIYNHYFQPIKYLVWTNGLSNVYDECSSPYFNVRPHTIALTFPTMAVVGADRPFEITTEASTTPLHPMYLIYCSLILSTTCRIIFAAFPIRRMQDINKLSIPDGNCLLVNHMRSTIIVNVYPCGRIILFNPTLGYIVGLAILIPDKRLNRRKQCQVIDKFYINAVGKSRTQVASVGG